MRKRSAVLMAALVMVAATVQLTRASDRVAVYAKIDRVTLDPKGGAPDTVVIAGVFSVALPNNGNDYRSAAKGYLYFKPGTDRDAARREWSDLVSVAGTGQVVAFGSRWESKPRLRQASEPPADPDAYAVNVGVVRVQGRTDYAPIRALIEFKP